jgi:AGZA family xanthine/uracil permease-like MFS transporter
MGALGLTAAEAMGVIVAEGLVITVLVLLGIRRYVMEAIPLELKQAISVGIGLFILFIGLVNGGIVVRDEATLVRWVT